jgi:hypothetical protein
VIANADGLEFIVLDELHTYRGRQGADVAMLVRRLRDRLCRRTDPICIGTSATMASEGGSEARAAAVAGVASRLFGTSIPSEAVIDESLDRATDSAAKTDGGLKEPLINNSCNTANPLRGEWCNSIHRGTCPVSGLFA